MGKWSTVLRAGKYIVNNPATRAVGKTVLSPAKSLSATGTALKTATIGAGVGYVGWQALVNDKPMVRTVADVALGEGNVDKIVDRTGEVVDSAQQTMTSVATTAGGANSALGGISDFMHNLTSGQGGNMFSNLFSNILGGNVSGMSIVGLLAAGMMLFCHTGWLGKIGGALLAMALIGNNSRQSVTQQATPDSARQQTPEAGQSTGIRR
jgi:hypothetical protein